MHQGVLTRCSVARQVLPVRSEQSRAEGGNAGSVQWQVGNERQRSLEMLPKGPKWRRDLIGEIVLATRSRDPRNHVKIVPRSRESSEISALGRELKLSR